MHKSKNSFLEWLVYSLIFFFLYDIIWLLVDLPDFLQSVNGLYPELLIDFALCGLFSLSSLCLNRWLFRQRRFWREGHGHRVFVQNGLVVLGFNLLIAGGCELLLSLVAPKLMMQDIWGTSFLFGLIASLVALIHLRCTSPTWLFWKERRISPYRNDTLWCSWTHILCLTVLVHLLEW